MRSSIGIRTGELHKTCSFLLSVCSRPSARKRGCRQLAAALVARMLFWRTETLAALDNASLPPLGTSKCCSQSTIQGEIAFRPVTPPLQGASRGNKSSFSLRSRRLARHALPSRGSTSIVDFHASRLLFFPWSSPLAFHVDALTALTRAHNHCRERAVSRLRRRTAPTSRCVGIWI